MKWLPAVEMVLGVTCLIASLACMHFELWDKAILLAIYGCFLTRTNVRDLPNMEDE